MVTRTQVILKLGTNCSHSARSAHTQDWLLILRGCHAIEGISKGGQASPRPFLTLLVDFSDSSD
eukprot:1159113-Pelagomonas_calceolata.AAC.6